MDVAVGTSLVPKRAVLLLVSGCCYGGTAAGVDVGVGDVGVSWCSILDADAPPITLQVISSQQAPSHPPKTSQPPHNPFKTNVAPANGTAIRCTSNISGAESTMASTLRGGQADDASDGDDWQCTGDGQEYWGVTQLAEWLPPLS
ncbi:hypothetical protein BJ741DRAFT_714912 [Chytriomyces cf. hyalinus JEL632]|nr:hypothetical protein BJ741DRAFT_714912 [Chytriomyces cf. hyalinus JEL632]